MNNATPAVQTLRRRFRMGATLLDDIQPEWLPERVLAAYIPNYPFLQGATLDEPVVEGDCLVYGIRKPAAQTKGAGKDVDAALDDIRAWGQAPVADPSAVTHWTPVLARLLENQRDRARTEHLDPFLIPLA